ncbi:nucleotide-binding alpha-beta plait domain-containing protein [Tanacetum coccineum]|uniref:Nucleotide-binding alpha-beta plait domain-containing protein n=1 Tax=Tanacetum coccineum TaxID=301880 RepID=A0ABQ5B938_9ASTR
MGDTDGWKEVSYKKNRSNRDRVDLPSIQKMSVTGRFRSKEDDVDKISTSIYVTNFPDYFSAKDLFNTCKIYGHVVDSYIPFKKSKTGKRFGFVRFINVFNEERLVNNLCTIWMGRLKLYANSARFKRPSKKDSFTQDKQVTGNSSNNYSAFKKDVGMKKSDKSYAQATTGINHTLPSDNAPSIVLDEECLLNKPLDNSLLGRVKEIASLSNLKKALGNEGFDNFSLHYMGELWVLIEFDSSKSKKLFQDNTGVQSWFSHLKDATSDFHVDGRIVWIEIEGVPFRLWSCNTFKRIASKWGVLLDIDDPEETGFHSKRLCISSKLGYNIFENFKIIFRGKAYWIRAKEVPGWVPDFSDDLENEDSDTDPKDGIFPDLDNSDSCDFDGNSSEIPETIFETAKPTGSTKADETTGFKDDLSEDPFNIYPILNKKVGSKGVVEPSAHTPNFPPGFTPPVNEKHEQAEHSFNKGESIKNTTESDCSGHFKQSAAPRSQGSILNLMEDLIKVGHTMGYNMDGCLNNLTQIIESQGEAAVFR